MTCCRVLLRNSWLSVWLRPLPTPLPLALFSGNTSDSGGVVGLCTSSTGHNDPTTDSFPTWKARTLPSLPQFSFRVRGWRPKRKPCSDVLGRHCLQKMALESFLHVGGIRHFSLSAFHGGTQAWPVSGIPLVAACPSSGAPSVVAPAPWVLLSLLWGGGLLAGHRQAPLAFAGPRAHWCKWKTIKGETTCQELL